MSDPDVPVRRVAVAIGALTLVVVCAVTAVVLLLRHDRLPLGGGEGLPGGSAGWLRIGGAALESAPQQDLKEYLAEKQGQLNGLGWVDADRRYAHIPIEAAMALSAKKAAEP
ncbi:MAG: hypothetical protein JWQ11_2598 [Rhizobacter sp.]|nr:hypothetical protein [Rhizobacter sp.]